jgi:hypothetical protein
MNPRLGVPPPQPFRHCGGSGGSGGGSFPVVKLCGGFKHLVGLALSSAREPKQALLSWRPIRGRLKTPLGNVYLYTNLCSWDCSADRRHGLVFKFSLPKRGTIYTASRADDRPNSLTNIGWPRNGSGSTNRAGLATPALKAESNAHCWANGDFGCRPNK